MSLAEAIPPIPIIGMFPNFCVISFIALNPKGSIPRPDIPPTLFVKIGLPSTDQYFGPTVLIAVIPYAPALIAEFAISTILFTFGVNFANTGFLVLDVIILVIL